MQNRQPMPCDEIVIPAFAPVPRKHRHDGWTAERQRAFIEALADTGSVRAAATRINMSPEGAYYLRRQPGADEFRAAWSAALDYGVQHIADIAVDRALQGVPVPVYWRGEQVGEKRWFNDRLLMFILRHHLADRYGGPGLAHGTRNRATIEREAAENCPVCREREANKATDDGAEAEADMVTWLGRLLERYAAKVAAERRHRLSGEIVAADFTLRQLTHIELILDLGGCSQDLIAHWSVRPPKRAGAAPEEIYASPLSAELDTLRRAQWAEAGDPPRPPLAFPDSLPSLSTWGGATMGERTNARREAEATMALAQRKWEAAATEEGWQRWQEEN
ncbi:hypothetical protein [uncultured Sphingomonas sp.]|uniref:hypothetical protein n=1 Tax=uncultured Sphingomonas sp. TaxID=158754 RepID=UPI0035CC5102